MRYTDKGVSGMLDEFDNKSKAMIEPRTCLGRIKVDVAIVTFSRKIAEEIDERYACRIATSLISVSESVDVLVFAKDGVTIAAYKSPIGGPASAGALEEFNASVEAKHVIVFGSAGCLDREIEFGQIMVPVRAYRDEGTSYHYLPESDWVGLENWEIVFDFFTQRLIKISTGGVWTTDAIFRETRNNVKKHKADGCIAVDMECASLQAVCKFRGIQLYYFFMGDDLLDAPVWVDRISEPLEANTKHDFQYFELAVKMAVWLCKI